MFHAVCLQIVPAKMENPDNEDIIIPACNLPIAAGIQLYRGNRFGRLWVRPWISLGWIYPMILSPFHTNGGDSPSVPLTK
jgi:hypothetical protein